MEKIKQSDDFQFQHLIHQINPLWDANICHFPIFPISLPWWTFPSIFFLYERGSLWYQNLQENLLGGMEFVQTKGSDLAENAHAFFCKAYKINL